MQPQAQGRAERAVTSAVKWVRAVQLSSAMGQGRGGSGAECLLWLSGLQWELVRLLWGCQEALR